MPHVMIDQSRALRKRQVAGRTISLAEQALVTRLTIIYIPALGRREGELPVALVG